MVAALGFAWGRRPSVATRCRPFRDGAGAAFEPALAAWLRVEAPPGEALAIDGKTLRSSHGEAMPGRQLLAAYAHGRAAVRGPRDLRQPVVTGAVPCCQRDRCTPILAQGGDDLFVGQGVLVLPHHQRDAGSGRARPPRDEPMPADLRVGRGHGREELRLLRCSAALVGYTTWPGLRTACTVQRVVTRAGTTSYEESYAVTSLPLARVSAAYLPQLWRGTGAARTACTGSAMSPSGRIAARCAPGAARRRSPPCAIPSSAWCAAPGIPTLRRPCAPMPADRRRRYPSSAL